jgi:hypothetical protein
MKIVTCMISVYAINTLSCLFKHEHCIRDRIAEVTTLQNKYLHKSKILVVSCIYHQATWYLLVLMNHNTHSTQYIHESCL